MGLAGPFVVCQALACQPIGCHATRGVKPKQKGGIQRKQGGIFSGTGSGSMTQYRASFLGRTLDFHAPRIEGAGVAFHGFGTQGKWEPSSGGGHSVAQNAYPAKTPFSHSAQILEGVVFGSNSRL